MSRTLSSAKSTPITSKCTTSLKDKEEGSLSTESISISGSYCDYLNAFTRIPSEASNHSSQFFALPIFVKSAIRMSIMPLTRETKQTLEALVSFEKNTLPTFQKSRPLEFDSVSVYGFSCNGYFCRIQKFQRKDSFFLYDTTQALEDVNPADVFVLPAKIASLPSIQYRSAMSGLYCTDDSDTEFTRKLVFGKILLVKDAEWITNSNGIPIILGTFFSFDGSSNYCELIEREGLASNRPFKPDRSPKEGLASNRPFKPDRSPKACNCSGDQLDLHRLADLWGLSKICGQKLQYASKVPSLHTEHSLSGTIQIYSTVIESPNCVWAQVFHEGTADFQKLMEELNEVYMRTTNATYVPSVGDVSAAKFSDGLFYRAQVLSVETKGSVVVKFLDYGNTATLSFKDLRHIRCSFMSLPRQAVCFSLAHISPFGGTSWSLEACQLIQDLMLEKPLEVEIVGLEDSTFLIEAFDASGTNIGDILIQRKLAVKFSNTSKKIVIGRGSIFNFNTEVVPVVGSKKTARDACNSLGGLSQSTLSLDREADSSLRPGRDTSDTLQRMFSSKSSSRGSRSNRCSSTRDRKPNKSMPFPMTVDNVSSSHSQNFSQNTHDSSPVQSLPLSFNGATSHNADECSLVKSLPLDVKVVEECIISAPTYTSLEKAQIPNEFTSVILSHVCSPDELYVNIAVEPYLSHISSLTNDSFSGLTPLAAPPKAGDVYAAQFSEDNKWYRVVVTEVKSGDQLIVQFIDFGNYETVYSHKVMACPKHLLSIPVLAAKCSIGGISPASGSGWDPSCARFLSESYSNSILQCRSLSLGQFDVELVDASSSDNLAVVLVQKSYAKSSLSLNVSLSSKDLASQSLQLGVSSESLFDCHLSPAVTADNSSGSSGSPVMEINNSLHSLNSSGSTYLADLVKRISFPPCQESLDAIIVHVESLSEIYILLHENMQVLMELTSLIEPFYAVAPKLPSLPSVGQLCLAMSAVNGVFRGEIISIDIETSSCTLKSIDYGSVEVLPFSALRQVNDAIFGFERQALVCGVTGLVANMDDKGKMMLEEKFMQVEVTCHISSHMPLLVDFIYDGVSFQDELVKSSILPPFQNPHSISPSKVVLNNTKTVVLTHTPSPKHFWVQIASEETASSCEMLCCQLQEFSQKALPLTSPVALGKFVIAKFIEDNLWYRAQIIDVSDVDPVVRFVDFGNTQKTSLSHLRSLSSHLTVLPAQAIFCSLDCFVFPSKYELFREMVTDQLLQCTFKDCVDVGIMVVDLCSDGGNNLALLLKD